MSFLNDKKNAFKSALENGFIKLFDYNTFNNITPIDRGGFGSVRHAYSNILRKDTALKSLYENFDESFVREVIISIVLFKYLVFRLIIKSNLKL